MMKIRLHTFFAFLFSAFSFFATATEETYSVRLQSEEISEGTTFDVIDGRFYQLGLDLFKDKSTKMIVKFGVDENVDYGFIPAYASLTATLKVEALDADDEVLASETQDLTISYSNSGGINTTDLSLLKTNGFHRYRVTIEALSMPVPENVFLEGELSIDRFYDLDMSIPTIGSNYVAFLDTDNDVVAYNVNNTQTGDFVLGDEFGPQELEVYWDYVQGAEEYELQWTWVDDYDQGITELVFNERDFELNNTRLLTADQRYRIPLIYAKGFLLYRVRAVGRWTDNDLLDTDILRYGPWSTDAETVDIEPTSTTISAWPHYIQISIDHENLKNWQYQAVYAEEGKKKEIVSYFDGSLRNRQTVTRLNSDNQAIVGENIYDNQGRAAIQILPTPVGNATLTYYNNLNQNLTGAPYTHFDFDFDALAESCATPANPMSDISGASKYYSPNNEETENWQDYIPDAEDYPFVQMQYTPDNTGRIRRQSGVGETYRIDGEHETQYFYLQPFQEELNRLFGYQVGDKKRYKKNLVVDANGQVSISYIDPQGRVVATALSGDNSNGSGGFKTNLESLDEHSSGNHVTIDVDLLNKFEVDDPDSALDDNLRFITGNHGSAVDALNFNTQYPSVDAQTHTFSYNVRTGTFVDDCMNPGVAYPFAYDLSIGLKDDCGTDVLSAGTIQKAIHGTTDSFETYTGSLGGDYSTDTDLSSFAAFLTTGSYTLSKRIQVNPDTLDLHVAHYLANLSPACLREFFEPTVDCFDELPDELSVDVNTCLITSTTMRADLTPGGQYGATDGVDITSVFTLNNALPNGQSLDIEENYQNPHDPYLEDDLTPSQIEVEFDGSVFTPEITTTGIDFLEDLFGDLDEGTFQVLPEHLANPADFIANWRDSWLESLIEYHPEYPYLAYQTDLCDLTTSAGATIAGEAISAENFNTSLFTIVTYQNATNALENIFNTNLILDANSGSTGGLKPLDPYFAINYPLIGDPSVNTFKSNLMNAILDDYKGSGLNLWQFVVKTIVCGSDLTGTCDASAYYADPSAPGDLTTDQLDQIWNSYKANYFSEKGKVDQIFKDVYAIDNDFYNGYIASETPISPSYTAFTYYPSYLVPPGVGGINITDLYLDAIDPDLFGELFPWLTNPNVSAFSEKIKRFQPIDDLYDSGLPEDELLEDIAEETDAVVFDQTGRCNLSFDVEFLIGGLASATPTNLLIPGSSVNSESLPTFTPDLYAAMGGLSGTSPVTISSTALGSGIELSVTNAGIGPMTSIFIDEPDIAGFTWSAITGLERFYYIPESGLDGVFDFQILVNAEISGEFQQIILTGNTTLEIGECNFDDDLTCDRDENFANDLKAIFIDVYDYTIGVGSFTTLPDDGSIAEIVGAWYPTSELLTQLGDNPMGFDALINASGTSFSFENPINNRELQVFFPSLPTNIITITGASYDQEDLGAELTIYYIDDLGEVDETKASVTDLSPIGSYLNLNCACEQESILAAAFEEMYNQLITAGETGVLTEPQYFDALELLFAEGSEAGTILVSQFDIDPDGLRIQFEEFDTDKPVLQCAPVLVSTEDISTIVSVSNFVVIADGSGDFSVTAFATLITGEMIPLEMSFESVGADCFQDILCEECPPASKIAAPVSCTVALDDYLTIINSLNTALPEDDALFAVYTSEEFCDTRLAYAVDAYLYYISAAAFDITSTSDFNYLTISEFSNTPFGQGYPFINDAIDAYVIYVDATPSLETLSWNDYVTDIYIPENNIVCLPDPLPVDFDFEIEYPCEQYTANTDTINAKNQEEIYLAQLEANFRERYIEEAISSLIENFDVNFFNQEYHYTLYYYDQAGNLIQTVPPAGVDRIDQTLVEESIKDARLENELPENIDPDSPDVLPEHTFETKYEYNSLNQLAFQITPDGGESRFAYDRLGRLVVSQNAKQKDHDEGEQFSYTRYDFIGRIIEVGEMTLSPSVDYSFNENARFVDPLGNLVDVFADDFPQNLGIDLIGQEEVTITQYDLLEGIEPTEFEDYAFDNIRNRITGVFYYENYTVGTDDFTSFTNACFYDYDVHGNVKEQITVNADTDLVALGQSMKKTKYEYDLVSGNVHEVAYQEDQADQFVHHYEYDADNRITNVLTSKDKEIWEQDAKYFYYDHGPMARMEHGDKKVQASDYAYTIQGWLKGVNSEQLVASNDQGKDAASGINSMNAIDVYGYSLHYYEDDYTARHGNDFLSLSESALPFNNDRDLFNGNIKEMFTASTGVNENYLGTSHTWYEYDQLNRIKDMKQERLFEGTSENRYAATYSFDQNGNLETLTRNAWDETAMIPIDDFSYSYYGAGSENPTNQLSHVSDPLGAVLGVDLDNQAINNYVYNEIGELDTDLQEEIDHIEWRVDGKVQRIERDPTSDKPSLSFIYDGMGNRLIKNEFDAATGELIEKTYYFRDAQGNCMSIYDLRPNGDATPINDLFLTERSIYGSSRCGIEVVNQIIASTDPDRVNIDMNLNQNIGDRRYELSNHLGNVLEVISDRKLQVDGETIISYKEDFSGSTTGDFTAGAGTTLSNESDALKIENTSSSLTTELILPTAIGEEYTLDLNLLERNGIGVFVEISQITGAITEELSIGSNTITIVGTADDRITGFTLIGVPDPLTPTVVIDDVKLSKIVGDDGIVDYHVADVVTQSDYYPFGMLLPNRNEDEASDYRYSFQGQEKDDEIKGENNSVNYKYRMHDPRVGRFFAVDPLAAKFSHNGPYNFSENRVIDGLELEGLEVLSVHISGRASLMGTASLTTGAAFDLEGNIGFFVTTGVGGGIGVGATVGVGASFYPTMPTVSGVQGWGDAVVASLHIGLGIEGSYDMSWDGEGEPSPLGLDQYMNHSRGGTVSIGVGEHIFYGTEFTYTFLHETTWEEMYDQLKNSFEDITLDDFQTMLKEADNFYVSGIEKLKDEIKSYEKEIGELNDLYSNFTLSDGYKNSSKNAKEDAKSIYEQKVNNREYKINSNKDKIEKINKNRENIAKEVNK